MRIFKYWLFESRLCQLFYHCYEQLIVSQCIPMNDISCLYHLQSIMGNQANTPNANTPKMPQEKSQQTNKNTLVPPAISTTHQALSPQDAQRRQLGMSQILNRFQKPQNDKSFRKSQFKIDPSRLVVTSMKGGARYGLDSQVVGVPFDVILATMDPQLMDTFKQLGGEQKEKYEKEPLQQQQWKLHGNGFYINYELGHELVIITHDMIYKGVVVINKQKKIVPDERGMLLTKKGKYKGQFKNGKSDGAGEYTDKQTKTLFRGTWKEGLMVHGQIINDQYQFVGPLEKTANGVGAIRFLKTGNSYTGNFVNGVYSTLYNPSDVKVDSARYKTLNYLYEGHFKNGKKEGFGRLSQFENSKNNNKNSTGNKKLKTILKYRPRDDYDGEWKDDHFVTTRIEREKKKIRDQQIIQDAENKIMQILELNLLTNQQPGPELLKPTSDKQADTLKTDVPVPEVVEEQDIQSQI